MGCSALPTVIGMNAYQEVGVRRRKRGRHARRRAPAPPSLLPVVLGLVVLVALVLLVLTYA
jgi:hypothetical protein